MFRLRTMYETLKVRLRSYRLPSSAINRPVIDKKLIDDEMVRTISLLFFTWILLIFLAVLVVMFFDDLSLMAALSGSVSSAGNMGPVYMPAEEMVELSVPSKLAWIFLMIAGRLEMLPVLAIFNRELFKDSK